MFNTFKVNRKSISSSVADHFKELILDQKFAIGERLPSEREMSQKLHVSRNTVREAYKILAAKGYVDIKHGNGVFVANYEENIKHLADDFFLKKDQVVELFTIRKVLETTAVRLAMERLDEKTEKELNAILEITRQSLKEGAGKEELSNLDQKFHLTLTKISGNSILLRIMMNLIDVLSEARLEAVSIPGRGRLSLTQHIKIVEAMIERDLALAEQAMIEHLESVEESILLKKDGGSGNASL
ncbi:FadR family transcriptional regulator [Alkalihalobacillus oceani]|uniref:FadR/GntR family transcriptional regulator n=1 Tax=Halalkalibacter oceani TaxID=1653776 RepID=UPI00203E7952|nr:FadR/GntR family transcriptional regulator [Halalkalibacter oceani]MCM3761853.1 FadR family transcriptional regulator [Halalkalibacter oceani]